MYKIKLHKKELSPLGNNMIVKGLLMLFIIAGASHSIHAQGVIVLEQQIPSTQVMVTATQQVTLKPGFHAIGSLGTFNAKIGSENSMSPVIPMAASSTAVIPSNPIIPIISIEPAVASSDHNYVVSTVAYREVTDPTALNETNSNTSIQYFDGLGRPTQTVQHGVTPLGADLVSGIEYNDYGLEYIKYLPGAVQGNNGAYVTDISSKATATNADSRPYSTTLYEASPLNRVKTEIGPGIDWSYHPKTIDYQTNDASILYFYVNGDKHLSKGSNYAAGSLFVTKVSDEDVKTAYEFKDKLGRVILKRQTYNGGNVDTYYVYNDLSQLCYVLPPKAIDEMNTSDLGDGNATIKQYCYLYQYDFRGNCTYKRLPGCEPIFMVYDRTDRLILSQDGNQRGKSPAQWTVSKYDQLGRVIFTGLTNSITASQTDLINSYKNDLVVETFNSGTYTNNKFSDATPLTINYYDAYSFISNGTLNYDSSQEQNGYTPQHSTAQGLLTGTRVYHLDNTSLYETTALYYDKYGRVVQSRATNHLGGYDLVYNELKFTGAPARTYKTHGINGASTTITELYTYDYNKAQQPTTTTYSLNGGSAITLVANGYDELGRLTTKKRHTNADTESYAYNVRSWVTSITSGGFAENLYYNANPLNSNATYNGNISYSTWMYNGATKGYLYDYDDLNRLLSANFKQVSSGLGDDSFNEVFTYDKMGNILTLKRKKNYTQIDNLEFHYSNNEKSNQLQYIDDGGATQNQYFIKEYQNRSSAQTEFAYDANGNMTKDLDRDIYTIKYNVLNLPDVVQFKNGNQIKNTYNAGGQKLGTEYFTWLPGANAPLINIGDVLNIGYSQGAIDQSGAVYIGNVEYNTKNGNSSLTAISRIHNMEGYVENISSPNYYYYRKDHLGNNREVWLANTNTTKQWTQYYPSGLPWVTTSNDNLSTQPYKYGDKEFVEMHGLDEYDSQARWFYPAIVRTPTLDPLCENYFDISPYAWCGNNPVNGIDPNGMAVWTTSDPATIREVFNAYATGTDVTYNSKTWSYQSDAEALRKKDKDEGYSIGLNYNGETKHYFLGSSYSYGISLADLGKGPKLMSDPNSSIGMDGCYNTYTPNQIESALNTYASIAGGELGGAALGALWADRAFIVSRALGTTIKGINVGRKAVTTANYAASILQNANATSKLAKVGFVGAGLVEGYIKSNVELPYDFNPHLIEDPFYSVSSDFFNNIFTLTKTNTNETKRK